jgi:hypothetical protein
MIQVSSFKFHLNRKTSLTQFCVLSSKLYGLRDLHTLELLRIWKLSGNFLHFRIIDPRPVFPTESTTFGVPPKTLRTTPYCARAREYELPHCLNGRKSAREAL